MYLKWHKDQPPKVYTSGGDVLSLSLTFCALMLIVASVSGLWGMVHHQYPKLFAGGKVELISAVSVFHLGYTSDQFYV